MAEQRCPMCGLSNPAGVEVCEHCGARLKPLLRESPDNTPIRPGEAPVDKDTHEFEDTDFLRQMREKPPIHPGDLPQPQETSELEHTLPAWLRRLRGTAGAEEAEAPAAAAADRQPEPPAEPEPQAANGTVSDWLADLTQAEDETGELPDWLAELGSAATGEPAAAETTESEPAPAGGDLPDWLSGLSADEPAAAAPAAETTESEPAPAGDDLPDWLSGLSADEPAAEAPAAETTESEPALAGDDLPDWLSGLSDLMGESAESASVAELEAALQEAAPLEAAEEEQEASLSAPPLETGAPALIMEEDEGLDALNEALPDWLAALKPVADGEEESSLPAETDDDSLAPADLPSWVQSMRPLEDVLDETLQSDLGGESAEEWGPLAGLRGVLPINDQIALTSKPELQGYKLEVSEGQKQTMALLESLLEEEKRSVAVDTEETDGALRFIRWGLSLALLLVISLIHLTGVQVVPEMNKYPPETLAFMEVMNTLEVEKPALIVIDYDPAYVGEMEWALSPVMQHLQARGVPLVALSTSPTGSALGKRVLPAETLQLGYLPGGPAGILGWALSPTTTLPQDVQGQPAWQDLPVQSLNDFSLILVATHDPTLARQWVEQTTGLHPDVPLMMVISAQAEPLVRPYYDSGQIAGLVTGVPGGQAYGVLQGFPAPGNAWSAYSVGLTLAALLVAVGSLWSLVTGWQDKRRQAAMAEA